MSQLLTALGRVVRSRRTAAGHSQEGFADIVGVHRTYMGAVERGEKNISLRNLQRIAEALNLRGSQLLGEAEAILSGSRKSSARSFKR